MLDRQVERDVRVMLGDGQIPSGFDALYDKVKVYADRAQGKQALSVETLALALALYGVARTEPVEIKQPEPEKPKAQKPKAEPKPEPKPEPEPEPEPEEEVIPVFLLGSKVSMYIDGELVTGEIISLPSGKQKKYKVKYDESVGYFDENELFLAD